MIESIKDIFDGNLNSDDKFIISDDINCIKIDVGLAGEAPNSAIWLDETPDRFVIGIEPLTYHWRMLLELKTANSKREYPKNFKFIQLERGVVELDGVEISKIGNRFCAVQCAIDDVGENLEFMNFYEMDRTDGASGSSSLLQPSQHHPHFVQNIVETPVISLESLLSFVDWNRFSYIEQIKTDCEGKDYDVVRSIGKYLDRILFITSEMVGNTHHWINSCDPQHFINWMNERGFEFKHLGSEALFINRSLYEKHKDSEYGLNFKTLGC